MGKTVLNSGSGRLTEADYREIRDYIVGKTGLNLQADKDADLKGLLAGRMAEEFPGWPFSRYYDKLQQEGDAGSELRYLVSRLTVGETHFFRNRPQVEALRNVIFPELMRRKSAGSRSIRIWSAGCSTGEEPYTLAMILRELIADHSSWNLSILATDINMDALAAARKGFYREWSFRDVDEFYMRRYFSAGERGWQISPELQEMVSFRYLNLAEDLYPTAVTRTDDLDLIVCRNVMIYFTVDLCLAVTERFFNSLRDGGYLLVGHSEHHEMVSPRFQRKMHEPAIYYQKGGAGAWERAIKLRFRGSGEIPRAMVSHEQQKPRARVTPRPQNHEETVLFEEAATLYRKRKLEESGDIFRRIVRMNKGNLRARYMLALIAADTGDIETAEREGLEILKSEPLHLKAVYLLSLVYRIKGQPEQEIECLKKAVYINRDFVMGHFQMGVYYLKDGNERLAVRSLRNVLELLRGCDPSNVIEGVQGLTVEGLRRSVAEMFPGGLPEGYAHE